MIRVRHVLPILALLGVLAPPALAKDLCLQVDIAPGGYSGSHILLEDVSLSARKFGPVHGYFARWDSVDHAFRQFFPVDGQAIVSSKHFLILGLTMHEILIYSDATFFEAARMLAINLACRPGPNGKIGLLDECNGYIFGDTASGHVISCHDVPPIP